jgi:hypothetical protein
MGYLERLSNKIDVVQRRLEENEDKKTSTSSGEEPLRFCIKIGGALGANLRSLGLERTTSREGARTTAGQLPTGRRPVPRKMKIRNIGGK